MTADKAPRRWTAFEISDSTGPNSLIEYSREFIEASAYDALAAELEEMKFHWQRATKHVMPGTFDTAESIQKYIKDLEAELSREKKKVEKLKKTLRWFADGGPVFSVFSRTMEPTFGSVNAKQAADVLAELEALDKESEAAR